MSELAEIRELLESAGAKQFSYNNEKQTFYVGGTEVTVQEAIDNPRVFYRDSLNDHEQVTEKEVLATTTWQLVSYPRFYDWLQENFDRAKSVETAQVMIDVFATLRPDISMHHLKSERGGFMGFSAERIRHEHPHIYLTVLGNCACLGVSVHGMIGEREWGMKFASYETHNIDRPEQKISLLAGLGHLAHLAEQS